MRTRASCTLPAAVVAAAVLLAAPGPIGPRGAGAQQMLSSASGVGLRLRTPPRHLGDRWPLMFTWSRNKVNWWNLEWRSAELPSSTLYYYDRAEPVARLAAWLVAESDSLLQRDFSYDLQTFTASKRIPKIIYTSHHTFEQTNTISQYIPEGLGGFTEYIKGRVVFPYTGSNADFRHVLEHENVHAHMIHKLKHVFKAHGINDTSRLLPVLWFSEGMAEYESAGIDPIDRTHRLDPSTEMYLRDGVLNDRLPTIKEMRLYPDYARVYKYGHALVQYLGARFGQERLLGMFSQWHHLYPNRNSFNFLRRRPLDTFDPLNPGVEQIEPWFIRLGDHDLPVELTPDGWRARTAAGRADSLQGHSVADLVAGSENLEVEGTWFRIVEGPGGKPALYRPDRGELLSVDGREAEGLIRRSKQEYEAGAYRLLSFERLMAWWLGADLDVLSAQWHEAVKGYYTPWLQDHGRISQYERLGEAATELWPSVSDDGRVVLYKAYRDNYVYEMILLDRMTGQRIRLAQDNTPEVESLHVLAEGGDVLLIGPDRYRAVFTAQSRHRDVIYLQDLVREPGGKLRKSGGLRIVYDPAPTDLVALSGVRFAGGPDRLFFSGLRLDGMEDIYMVQTGRSAVPVRLTRDLASDRTPVLWGDRIVFSSDRAGSEEHFEYHLFSMDLEGGDLTQLTMSPGNEKSPAVDRFGERLFFESDATGVSNIYEWSVAGGVRAITDVSTGAFAPAVISPDTLLVAGFDDQAFNLFLVPISHVEEAGHTPPDETHRIGAVHRPEVGPEWVEMLWDPERVPSADRRASGGILSLPYRPRFSLDDFYASSEFGGYRTYNAAVFGTEARFSDLLGEHVLGIAAWNGPRRGLGDFSWVASYWNQKQHLKWGGAVYKVTGVYFNLVRQDFYIRDRAGFNGQFNYPFDQFSDLDLVVGTATERRRLGTVNRVTEYRELEVGLGFTRDVSGWGPQGPHRGWVVSAFYDHTFLLDRGLPTFNRYLVADVRGYVPLHRYVVAAGRVARGLSTGREPEFFFLGGGLFLRGYWDLYDLYGSSYTLGNGEIRVQPLAILGVDPPKMFEPSGWPLQMAFFAEAGEARWDGGRLGPLGSAGVSLRLTLALPFVLEYAWYRQEFWKAGTPWKRGLLLTLLF